MISRSQAHVALAQAAESQAGLVTCAQAQRLGVGRVTVKRLADAGLLERLARAVYRLAGVPFVEHAELRAAWLQLRPGLFVWERLQGKNTDAVVSHESAAEVLGLGEMYPRAYEFSLNHARRSRRADVMLHPRPVRADEWMTHSGLPVTTAARTVSDLAGEGTDGGHLASVVADALRLGLLTDAEAVRALAPHAAKYGMPAGDGAFMLRDMRSLAKVCIDAAVG